MDIKRNANPDEDEDFYERGKKYWETIAPNVNGMLGGYDHVSIADIKGSDRFLRPFVKAKRNPIQVHRALDCGAGIGRVTKHLLLNFFDFVDMVEQNQAFLDESVNYIGEKSSRVERRICSALQEFVPEPQRYNVIWCQWVIAHIKDKDVIEFFKRCQLGLTDNGLLVVKDNITSSNNTEMDAKDSSISRPLHLLRDLIHQAGYSIIKESKQDKFPEELYEVRMFACKINK